MKKNKKKYGFTLTELLAVILVLSLVLGIASFVVINVINSSREKGYKVTVNNVEKVADSYVAENDDKLFYITDNIDSSVEYQCVTVGDLVDGGYFKSDIVDSYIDDNRNVSLDDYVYIERDISTKTVKKIEYLLGEDVSKCDEAVKAMVDISIKVNPVELSSSKEIEIRYKLKNYYNIDNYDYKFEYVKNDYSYEDIPKYEVIGDNGNVKKIRVTDNGKIVGYVVDKGNTRIDDLDGGSKDVTTIDKTPPVINVSDITRIYGSTFDLFDGVDISDNSGLNVVKKVYLDGNEINDVSSLKLGENIVTYKAIDLFGNESSKSRKITLVVADKEFNYKEEDQIYEVEAAGTYVVEAYGSQGGNSGGKGGYVKAEVKLSVGDKLVINTGGINGYNGGGGYKKSSYNPGGGATTVKYGGSNIIIAGGGGAKGTSGTAGAGGSGNGVGGSDVGSGKGYSGTNGGGGSNSLKYDYKCNCKECNGKCLKYKTSCDTCRYNCNCREVATEHCEKRLPHAGWYCRIDYDTVCSVCYEDCNCDTYCSKYEKVECNCKTCTKDGVSGSGGNSKVVSPAVSVKTKNGSRSGNGYVKVSYKLED